MDSMAFLQSSFFFFQSAQTLMASARILAFSSGVQETGVALLALASWTIRKSSKAKR